MLIEIKKPITAKKLAAAKKKLAATRKQENKGFDAHRFCGTVKWKGDAVDIQRRMRNEWL